MDLSRRHLYLVGVFLTLSWGGGRSFARETPNSVVVFLTGAELKQETHRQRAEIMRALRDLLHEEEGDPGWLQRQRYADDQGLEDQWSIIALLNKYFVPQQKMTLDERTFVQDIRTAEAQTVIREWIARLMKAPSLVNLICPESVSIKETIQIPQGWTKFPGPIERAPQTIGLYFDVPSKKMSLKPFNGDEASDFYFWMELNPKRTYWMACGYGGNDLLAKSLPEGLTYCEFSRFDGKLQLACYP
jgi:hypothetical protein